MAATSSNPSSRTAAPVRGTANHARSGGLWLVMYITRTIASSSSRRRTYAPIGARPRVIRNSARARSIAARFRRRLSNQARAQSIIREATQRRFHWHIDSPTVSLRQNGVGASKIRVLAAPRRRWKTICVIPCRPRTRSFRHARAQAKTSSFSSRVRGWRARNRSGYFLAGGGSLLGGTRPFSRRYVTRLP